MQNGKDPWQLDYELINRSNSVTIFISKFREIHHWTDIQSSSPIAKFTKTFVFYSKHGNKHIQKPR